MKKHTNKVALPGSPAKLGLRREDIRALSSNELEVVAGGALNSVIVCFSYLDKRCYTSTV